MLADALHAADSSHTGSKLGPSPFHCHGPRGIGFLLHMDPSGVVPVETRKPSNSSCVLLSPSQRRMLLPTMSRWPFRNSVSVSGADARAMR